MVLLVVQLMVQVAPDLESAPLTVLVLEKCSLDLLGSLYFLSFYISYIYCRYLTIKAIKCTIIPTLD